jgi:hypothetical protein
VTSALEQQSVVTLRKICASNLLNMNVELLEKKLIAAARSNVPGDDVPYTFEKRVMALLASSRATGDNLVLWARGLWRAAIPCMAIAVLLGAWSVLYPASNGSTDLSQNFENTLLAAVDQSGQTE